MPATSRRERILEEIKRRMCEMDEGHPGSDPYTVTWDVVTRSGLEGLHDRKRHALSIVDTDENKTPKIQQMDANLRVVLEFRVFLETEEEASPAVNRVMTDIQRKMREDLHLTEPDDGRALNERELSESVVEIGNQTNIGGFLDRQAGGVVFYNVKYKHAIQDPRELVASL
jgi:hypothetical protein